MDKEKKTVVSKVTLTRTELRDVFSDATADEVVKLIAATDAPPDVALAMSVFAANICKRMLKNLFTSDDNDKNKKGE